MDFERPFKMIGNSKKDTYDIFDNKDTLVMTVYNLELAIRFVDSFNGGTSGTFPT